MKNLLLLISASLMLPLSQSFTQERSAEKIKPALLVIDIQNEYLPAMDPQNLDSTMYMINNCITFFRDNNLPIIRVYNTDPKIGPRSNTVGFQFPESILTTTDDPQVIKHHEDAFHETDLDKILKEKNVNTVFLCGLSAVGCVLATYVGAGNYSYKAYFIKDALMSQNFIYTKYIETIYEAVSLTQIKYMLGSQVK